MLTTARIVPGTSHGPLAIEDCRPELRRIHEAWMQWCGNRSMPARGDFGPEDIPSGLLPHIVLVDVLDGAPAERRYRIRLMGTAQVEFHGSDWTGRFPHEVVPEDRAWELCGIGDEILRTRQPRLASGQVYHLPAKPYARFQAIQLPLSTDQERIDMILGLTIFHPQ